MMWLDSLFYPPIKICPTKTFENVTEQTKKFKIKSFPSKIYLEIIPFQNLKNDIYLEYRKEIESYD